MKTSRFTQFGFAMLLFVAIVAAGDFSRAQTPAVSNPAPTIKLPGIDGKTYDVAEMRGSVVLVSFGATWCVPCVGELRALEELKIEFKDKPVKFLWIAIDTKEEATDPKVAQYAKARKLTIPVLRDSTNMIFSQFSKRLRLPMIVFFAKDGALDAPPHFGMSSQPEIYKTVMRQRLNKLLAQPRSEGQ
jgi:peroxiredoxin